MICRQVRIAPMPPRGTHRPEIEPSMPVEMT
jgi:hypothetical protein